MCSRACLIVLLLGLFTISSDLHAWQHSGDSTYRRVPGFVSPSGPYRPSETRTTDLIHTSLKLNFDWQKQEIQGVAILSLKPHFYPQDSLILDARAFVIGGIRLVKKLPQKPEEFDQPLGLPLQYTYDQKRLRIAFDKTYQRNDTVFIAIQYTARPNEAEKLTVDGINVEKGLYFINPDGSNPYKPRQLWTQGETTGGSSWFPTIEAPNEKFTQDIFLTVEGGQVSLSNGLLADQIFHTNGTRTDHWRQSLPHAPYLTAIAVGEFSKTTHQVTDGPEISYYVDPAYSSYADAIFGRTPEMISFFSGLFGMPYPWEKYAQVVVRDFVAGAMENTTLTVLREETQMSSRELLDGDSDALIAHELAHHWFGNLVTCEEWGQLPLNEAFANYAEYLWEEHRRGKSAADWLGYLEMQEYFTENETKHVGMIRYFYEHPDHMFDSHSYAKGGRILHMLRKYVGDEAFSTSLYSYLKQNQFGTAELANLRMAFEEVTGKDLNWFFDQWFYRPGHPELTVSHRYIAAEKRVIVTVQQVQDTLGTTVYRLPVEIDIWVKGKKFRRHVVIDRTTQEFSFHADAPPDLVLFDGDCALLGKITHEKTKPEWLYQLRHSEELLARYEAIEQLGSHLNDESVRKGLLTAMDDPFWKIRQEAVFRYGRYDGPGKKEVESNLKKMAASDPHPLVRGEALLGLESMGLGKFKIELRHALNDSSYAVVATAIGLTAKAIPEEIETVISRFQNVPTESVAAAVGDYFGDHPKPEHFEWYIGMMNRLTSSGCYSLLQSFGKYLVRSDRGTQQKGIDFLKQQARHHASISVRYGAYQLLSWFDDRPGIKTFLNELHTHEKNQQLLELYRELHPN